MISGYRLTILALITFLSLAPADEKPTKEKPAKADLNGTWVITWGERDGKEIPADRVKGSLVRFEGEKVVGTDKDKKEFFASTFKLDQSTTPWTVVMVSTTPTQGEKAIGIVELKDDTLKLAYALPGVEAPKEFKTKEKQHYFILRRAPKSEKE